MKQEEKALEEFCREVVHAARADEEVVNDAADSAFLYQRVRKQLAMGPQPLLKPRPFNWMFGAGRNWRWAVGAAATAAVVAMIVLTRWPVAMPPPPGFPIAAIPVDVAPMPLAVQQAQNPEASVRRVKASVSSRQRTNRIEQEVTTEYLPLIYVAQMEEPESRHVVRVQVPRAALATLGMPVGVEPPGELIKADLIVGDDGLARAIRFVR